MVQGLIGDKFVARKQKCLGKRKMRYAGSSKTAASPCMMAKETDMTGKLLLYMYLFCDLLEAIKL